MDLQPIIQTVDSVKIVLGALPTLSPGGDLPRLEDYQRDVVTLKQLAYLRTAMEKASSYIAQYYNLLDKQHNTHTTNIRKLIDGHSANQTSSGHMKGCQSAQERDMTAQPARNRSLADIARNPVPAIISCEVVPGVNIPAIVVNSFAQVGQTGDLYYIPHCDHFAIKIAGKLLHGNVGTIYCADRTLEKVKDCRFVHCANDPCDFYHDPCKHAGRKDRRNFVANSWLYIPPDSRKTGDIRGRRVGSKDSLAGDLAMCTVEEASRFKDQTFHDLLCALLL